MSEYCHSNPISNIDPEGLFFLSLTTFEGAKRGVALSEAIKAGQPFREITAPAIIGSATAPYIGAIGVEATAGLVSCYRLPGTLYHYTTKEAAKKISQDGVINIGKKFVWERCLCNKV